MTTDDRDAWLDDVRRWYYGGTPPLDAPPANEPQRDDSSRTDGAPSAAAGKGQCTASEC